jgi:GNAT superfamily N-acetyltransferase
MTAARRTRADAGGPRAPGLRVLPATAARWDDLVRLFGPRGACGGCWCMYWRLPRSRFTAGKGAGNRRLLRRLVRQGPPPGLIGYLGGRPIAWCALGPRDSFPGLDRSRVLAPVDDRPVWSIVCLFVAKDHRRSGLSVRMLREAARWARRQGARIVEGYPVETRRRQADPFVWTGLAQGFRRAGFREVLRRSPVRPIMRVGRG